MDGASIAHRAARLVPGVAQPRRLGSATIAVLARTHLTPQHQIHLVEAMDRTLLISTSPAGSSVLFTQAVEKAQKSAGTAAG